MSARFSAVNTVHAYFKNSGGRIEKINVAQGATVQAGEVLMELNNDDLEYNLRKAEINLEIQTLQLENTRNYQGEGSLAYKVGALQLEIQQMEVDRLTEQVENCYLYAPIGGEVIYRKDDIAKGDTVTAYDILYTIADTSSLQLVSSDASANQLVVGMDVTVVPRGMRGRMGTVSDLTGTVVQSPADSPTDATSKAIVSVEGLTAAQMIQLYGQEATISVELETRTNVLYLPMDVINTNGNNKYVRVLTADRSVVEKSVTLGLTINNAVEILSGVEEGEVVIYK